ncbi:MAG: glucose-1-phosphate adenylyltransferase [Candidatus Hydrogenedentes bacterium]|nr:glucose-1-phosphate adenylyltransferase [Candidatus Hydrogenedentota bacterium]
MKNVLTVLLAGGVGARLHPLTRNRAKPAVPFGGQFRIVDFTLSNCINSECTRIQVLVQYKSLSLVRHIRQGWNILNSSRGEYIETIAPQMRVNENWYQGTADALYHNLYSLEKADPKEVLILSGDHIYKMNYQKMIHFHREREADVTIATIDVPIDQGSQFGILGTDGERRVVAFDEKPLAPKPLPNDPSRALASMGIYVFNPEILKEAVVRDSERDTAHDFGRDIIPELIDRQKNVYAYPFQDENKKQAIYWRDVGTLDTYWEANMDLASVDPLFNLYDKDWPLHTYLPVYPPVKFVFASPGQRYGVAIDSIVCNGSIISGGMVKRSVLSPGVRINTGAEVDESILFAGCSIGRHAKIRRAIIEKNVAVPPNTHIGYNLEEDAKWHRISPQGIVVVESLEQRLAPVKSH